MFCQNSSFFTDSKVATGNFTLTINLNVILSGYLEDCNLFLTVIVATN